MLPTKPMPAPGGAAEAAPAIANLTIPDGTLLPWGDQPMSELRRLWGLE